MKAAKLLRLGLFAGLILGLFMLLGTGALAAPPGGGAPGLEQAKQVQEANTPALMARPGVVGTAVSIDDNGRPVIRIFTESESVTGIPANLQGIPVETVVTGIIWAQDTTAKYRPAPIGVSVGHPNITAGTLGARVVDGQGNAYILSNNHVLANSNNANIGDNILQPGAYDGGSNPGDAIGTLFDFEPIVFGGSPNYMDAAIASVPSADLLSYTLSGGYGSPSSQIVNAGVGQSVQKCGRTTECTTGTVEEVNVTVSVCFAGFIVCTRSATFVNQFTITPGTFSAGGDSGSLIVTNNAQKNPVGLLFAGSSTRTIANPIGVVLNRFNVTIDDGSGSGPSPTATPTTAPSPTATATPAPDPTATPAPGTITLSVTAYKVRGLQKADLNWNGATSTSVDIRRNGAIIATVANNGFYTDNIDQRGGGSYAYQVCEAGTSSCSNSVQANY
jgi:hypothetical protein